LLDGLEAVELRLSRLLVNNEEFRFDSEFFKKEFFTLENYLLNSPKLDDLVYMSDLSTNGSFKTVSDIIHDDNPKVVPFIRSGNTGEAFIKKDELIFISQEAHNRLPKSTTKLHDIIMARKGKIGGATIIMPDEVGFNCNENVIKLDINNKEELNPFYFISFFNSKFGLQQIERLSTGNVQPWVSIFQIRKLVIPILTNNFQSKIEELVRLAHDKQKESKKRYKQSEELLLKELDLLDFKPSKEKIAIKSLSESFGESGRLDSEYYQLKYDEIIDKIKSYKGGFEFLNIVCNLKDKNCKPQDKEYYQYVELSNIGTTGDITGFTYEQGQDLPSRARRLINENDVIISSIEGSLEKIAIVRKELDNSLCSTGFYVVNSNKINSETLLVLFKNKIMQQILKQKCSGTILTGMNKDDFLDIIIPNIDDTIQVQIEEKIKESFQLKEESKQLLEVAKKAVEVAIEKNEEIAISLTKDAK